jgi:ArsR family transcriptional regulator
VDTPEGWQVQASSGVAKRRRGGDGLEIADGRIARIDNRRYIYNRRYEQVDRMSASEKEPVACCAPLSAPALSDDEAVATAGVFRALADPARVRIVNVLATSGEPVCVCNLVEPLGLSQPTVSHHLRKLMDAGLVAREERGRWAYYSLRPESVRTLTALVDMKGACCR